MSLSIKLNVLSIAGKIAASAWCWQHKEVMLVVEAATPLIK
jgi:hypothetical protein